MSTTLTLISTIITRLIYDENLVLISNNLSRDVLALRLFQVKSAQFKLNISAWVRIALRPGAVLAVGGLTGLQIGREFLSAAYGGSTVLQCTKMFTESTGMKMKALTLNTQISYTHRRMLIDNAMQIMMCAMV